MSKMIWRLWALVLTAAFVGAMACTSPGGTGCGPATNNGSNSGGGNNASAPITCGPGTVAQAGVCVLTVPIRN